MNLTAAMNGVSNINTRLKSPSSVRANLRVQLVYPFRRRLNVTSYGFACGAFTRCLTRLWWMTFVMLAVHKRLCTFAWKTPRPASRTLQRWGGVCQSAARCGVTVCRDATHQHQRGPAAPKLQHRVAALTTSQSFVQRMPSVAQRVNLPPRQVASLGRAGTRQCVDCPSSPPSFLTPCPTHGFASVAEVLQRWQRVHRQWQRVRRRLLFV